MLLSKHDKKWKKSLEVLSQYNLSGNNTVSGTSGKIKVNSLTGYTKLCNAHNEPQPPTTSHNEPQPSTTSHNELQWTTTTYNEPQRATTTCRNHPENYLVWLYGHFMFYV